MAGVEAGTVDDGGDDERPNNTAFWREVHRRRANGKKAFLKTTPSRIKKQHALFGTKAATVYGAFNHSGESFLQYRRRTVIVTSTKTEIASDIIIGAPSAHPTHQQRITSPPNITLATPPR